MIGWSSQIELKGVPEETVRRIPVGGGLGVLAGFAAGALVYARLRRPQDEPGDTDEGPDAEPAATPDRE